MRRGVAQPALGGAVFERGWLGGASAGSSHQAAEGALGQRIHFIVDLPGVGSGKSVARPRAGATPATGGGRRAEGGRPAGSTRHLVIELNLVVDEDARIVRGHRGPFDAASGT